MSGRYALGTSMFAAGLFLYVATEFSWERRNEAFSLNAIIMAALILAFVLGLIGLPKLESFVALFVFTLTSLFLLPSLLR